MEDKFAETSQEKDEAAEWKKKYMYMLADLENTKKRLSRSSAQEIEEQKKELLRDVLPIADCLDMALMHLTHQEECKNISGSTMCKKSMSGGNLSIQRGRRP